MLLMFIYLFIIKFYETNNVASLAIIIRPPMKINKVDVIIFKK